MIYFNCYYSLMNNLFSFFILELFTITFARQYSSKFRNKLRFIFITILLLYTFIPHFPFQSLFNYFLVFFYICLTVKESFIKRILFFILYESFFNLSILIIYFLIIIIARDFHFIDSNNMYSGYKQLTCIAIIYILLNLYMNSKKISSFATGRSYKRQFSLIITISVLALSISSMVLGSTLISQENALPFVYSLLVIVIVLCLSTYRKISNTLEENALNHLALEKASMEKQYSNSIEESLKKLTIMRHDMKNHLLIIDGYASQDSCEKIHSYIKNIQDDYNLTNIIKTPSALISSIINAKQQECIRNNIHFTFSQSFSYINMDDYHLTTILGNILDNAITAASKVTDGFVNISIIQVDSYLEISCKNNHAENIQKKEGYFITSKLPSNDVHGIGLISIKKAVSSINGQMQIDYNHSYFKIVLILPNYQ